MRQTASLRATDIGAITSDPIGKAAKLEDLAKRLKMSPRQRAFAEALSADPQRNQSKAAEVAGSTAKTAPGAGSYLAKHPKVRAYLDALDAVSRQETRRTIMRRADILRGLAEQAAGITPSKRRIKRNAKGRMVSTVEEYDSLRAHVRLLDHSEWREKGPAGGTVNVWLQAVQAARQAPALAAASIDALAIDAELVEPTATQAQPADERTR